MRFDGAKHSALRALVAFCAVLCYSGNVWAYINGPTFGPQPLMANQPLQMRVEYGICDLLGEYPLNPKQFPNVVVQGNTIRVELFGIRSIDPISCVTPPSVATFPIGEFEPGNYQVEVVLASPIPDGFEYLSLYQIPIALQGSGGTAPITLPVNSAPSTVALMIGILLMGCFSSRRAARK